jgi:hypothetical protein
MKKILIIYYTQTGQLKQIVDSVTGSLSQDCQLFFAELKPDPPFPFPWRGMPFFQVFPESVKEIPCRLKPLTCNPEEDYDLVILAYQVWYLSPSIPISSFLQSEEAKKILKGKPVITVSGVRNMWIMAHERVKARIAESGGRLAGNIVLADPSPNLISVITIVRWMMNGERTPFRKFGIDFPEAGVPERIITDASRFGLVIKEAAIHDNFDDLQPQLVMQGAVKVDPVLMNIEKRGKMMFGFWAKMILKKGGYNDPKREGRLKLFRYYLFAVIYLLSPIVSLIFSMIFKINPAAAGKIFKRYNL